MTTIPTLPETERRFFTIGGTLPPDAPSYIERKADSDLLTHLSAGDFCYVLTSRQMGKSSLMVRTAARLRREGAKVALLDLTQIGQNVTPEQWYNGLLVRLGVAFGLEDELDDFWSRGNASQQGIGPLQRWKHAIRDVIVASIPGEIVIFVDEIDGVRNLPFHSDEFFAGIREFYNDRIRDPELKRITFCLIGVATPTDLIRNTSTTPFNIGFRVELSDFTEKEAEPFVKGMGRPTELGEELLRRILWWTGGHPYLTQRMCAAVAADPEVRTAGGVDRICSDLFLSSRSRETDNNLQFVSRRITDREDEAELAAVLDFYGRVHAGKKVPDDDTNRLIDFLRLAGVVKVRENRLVVRNRIYEHVFNRTWIHTHMPDAELRRQRAAFRRGLLLAAALAIAVIAAIGGLMLKDLEDQQQAAIQNYCVNMVQVQQDFDSGDYASGFNLLRETQPHVRLEPRAAEKFLDKAWLLKRALPFIRRHPSLYAILNGFDKKAAGGFEWNYLQARSFGDNALAYTGHADEVRSVAISPHGDWLATAGADSTVRIFDISQVNNSTATIPRLDRALLVLDSDGNDRSTQPIQAQNAPKWSVNQQLVNALTQRHLQVTDLPGVMSVQFSPDGRWIAVGTGNWNRSQVRGNVYLWSTDPNGKVIPLKTNSNLRFLKSVDTVVFKNQKDSAGALELAATSDDNTAEFWSIPKAGNPTYQGSFDGSDKTARGMNAAAYSPDGKTFAMIFGDGHVWLQETQQPWKRGGSEPFVADVSGLMSIVFYDNDQILLGTRDGRVVKLDLPNQGERSKALARDTFLETGHGLVTSLTVSADGNFLVTTGSSGVVLVWKLVRDEHGTHELLSHGENVVLGGQRDVTYSAAITPDERLIVSGGANALTGGSPNITPGVLTAPPGSRVLFWKLQPLADGKLPLPPKPAPIFSVSELAPITWASQPAQIQVNGAVPALAFSPARQNCPIPLDPGEVRIPVSKEIASIRGISKDTPAGKATEITTFTKLDQCTGKPADPPLVPQAGQTDEGTALAWSTDPEGEFVATAANDGKDGTVLLWDAVNHTSSPLEVPTYKVPKDNKEHPIPIQNLSFSPNGWLAGIGTGSSVVNHDFTWQKKLFNTANTVFLWRPDEPSAAPKVIALPPFPPPPGVVTDPEAVFSLQKLAFSASGDRMAACGIDSYNSQVKVQIWEMASLLEASPSSVAKSLDGSEYPRGHVHQGVSLHGQCSAVTFSPDGQWLAVGTFSHEIAVWSTATWKRVEGDFTAAGAIYGATYGAKAKTSTTRGRYLDAPPMANAAVNALAFSPDGMRLAYGTADAKIYLWSVTAKLPVTTIAAHSGGITALAFSPDGRCLASGSNDQTVLFSCEADQAYLDKRRDLAASLDSYQKLLGEPDNWIPFGQ